MEVVLISGGYPNSTPAGSGTYLTKLISTASKKGVHFTVIGIETKNNSAISHPFSYLPIVKTDKLPYSTYKFLFNLFFKVPFLDIPASSILHAQRPDYMLPFVLFKRKNPKVCTLHGNPSKAMDFGKNFVTRKIYGQIESFVLKHIDKVIAVDMKTQAFYLEKYPWIKDKLIFIPLGVDKFKPLNVQSLRKKYGLSKDDKIILYVGRFMKEKGLDMLIGAFKQVKSTINNSKLILVGDGECEKWLKNTINERRINGVIFFKSMEHDRIPEIMNCADVFALCSYYEGLPTVVLESLACGIPVVSTNVGDVSEIVKNNETGYLMETRNFLEMKNRLVEVLLKSNISKETCVKTAEAYSWEKIVDKIEEVYGEVYKKY
jgi:glycosyltransferase involved in cell wall biosynthesis